MKAGDTYDSILRELDREIRKLKTQVARLTFGVVCALLGVIGLAVLR